MTNSTLKTLRTHWDDICDGSNAPYRSDVTPGLIPEVLDTLFILEQLSPSDMRVRIAGLKICEMMGMEVRGQSPMTFFQDSARRRFDSVLNEVLTQPKIAYLGLDTKDRMGNPGQVEMILLPLRSDFGDVNRIIGCVTVPDNGFTAPLRYHITSVNMVNPFRHTLSKVAGFAEPEANFSHQDAPVLRSVDGNTSAKTPKRPSTPSYLKLVD